MPRLKRGDYAMITKPLYIRRKGGVVERFRGKRVRVVAVSFPNCRCDVGIGEIVNIPISHLQWVA